ncbi:MAG: polyhydroxyalkanoate depolymerase, partial [Hyphomicrobiaceae bacterium]
FVRHALPKGEMMHRGQPVDPGAIRRVAMMTIEGEKDDITGLGQCRAALELARNLPQQMKLHYECAGVGHYGIFNGSRFRNDIAPRIAQFFRTHDRRARDIPETAAVDHATATARAIAAREKRAQSLSGPQSGPFRLIALAGHLLIDGLFHMHTQARPEDGGERSVTLRNRE